MSETVSSGPIDASSSDDRNLALVVYLLLFASPFMVGFPALIGVVIAYIRRPEAPPIWKSHYNFQIRTFWVALALGLVAAASFIFGAGSLVSDIFSSVTNEGKGWDGWEIASVDVDNVRVEGSTIVGFALSMLVSAVASLWLMAASLFGFVRLVSGKAIGNPGA